MRFSIRTSLILGTIAATVIALALAGALIYSGIRNELLADADRSLENEARLLASVVELKPDGIDLGFEELDMRQFTTDDPPSHLQLWSSTGQVLYRSPRVPPHALAYLGTPPASLERRWIDLPGLGKARAVEFTFYPRIGTDEDDAEDSGGRIEPQLIHLVIARQPVEAERLQATMRTWFVLIGGAAAMGTAFLLYLVVRRGLRPLEQLAGSIAGLRDYDPGRRIMLPNVPVEIAPVVDQINNLLGRIEGAIERERSFSADIAHELRTPLSGLRTTMDVALSRSREPEEYLEALSESWVIVSQMQNMVEKLLYLGRLESDRLEVATAVVDLAELVEQAWQPVSAVASSRGLEVRIRVPSHLRIVTDRNLLFPAIRNVLENAAVHSNTGGRIEVLGETRGDDVALHVINTGSNVPQAEVDALFDRFYRRDTARGATGEHFGLGLPIVRKIVSRLGHAIDIRTELGGDFHLSFIFHTHGNRAVPYLMPIGTSMEGS